jgi:glycosyltransferase involved in cell wall biosynthesis
MRLRVIIPNYNKGQYIKETLDSLDNQVYQDFDVLIVDDGSADNSMPVILEYAKNQKTSVISKPVNEGITKTLNYAFSESGNYTHGIILASDDIVDPFWIQEMVDLQQQEQSHFTTTAGQRFGIDTGEFQACTAGMYDIEMWRELGGRDESIPFVHDIDMFIRMYKEGYKKRSVQKPLYLWRNYPQQNARQAGDTSKVILDRFIAHGVDYNEYKLVTAPNFN